MPRTKEGTLVPVQVPWMISPSTPFLEVFASEDSADKPTVARFIGYFALEEATESSPPESKQGAGSDQVFLVSNPFLGTPSDTTRGPSRYKKVAVRFTQGIWVSFQPTFDDFSGEQPDYDWSQVPNFFDPNQGLEVWNRKLHEEWSRTSWCPSPRMYEVKGSGWLKDLDLVSLDFKHFLLLGHDAEVEIIAKSWEWKIEGDVQGW